MGDAVEEPQLSEANRPPCSAQHPVWQRLNDSALTFSNRLAVASLHQVPQLYDIDSNPAGKRYLRWNYDDLRAGVDRLASSLEVLGAKKGLAVVTFLYNGVEFILASWAAHKLGCPFVPINPRALTNAEDAAHMLRVAGISIVIVQDRQLAMKIDALSLDSQSAQAKIVLSESPDPSWLAFTSLVSKQQKPMNTSKVDGDIAGLGEDDIVSILFTSGTTSLPKGVPHTDATLNAFCENLSLEGRSETSVFCSVLPNNHAMGYFYALHFMMHGAAVVYPSPTFEANAMVRGLEDEKATHTALVPTALQALLEALKTRGTPLNSSLIDVCLSGSSITPDNIRQAAFELRSEGISTGFGMTEGSPIWTGPKKNPEELINGDLAIAGPPSPGAHIRICNPESRLLVPRGMYGEIHQSGPGLVQGYLGPGLDMSEFYTDDDGRLWFATGDQGMMLPDGRVSIIGRYKDMIIRGGENIAPAAIENVINKFCGIQAQIVGAPDLIAGEVPVAILPDLENKNTKHVQKIIQQHMGAAFVPDEVLTLKELKLADFPKTVSGKIQKSRLKELVGKYRSEKDMHAGMMTSKKSIHDIVLKAYCKSTGISIEQLDQHAPTTNFAESISYMRVRDSLRKELGFTLTVSEMVECPNIASQTELLCRRNAQQQQQQQQQQQKNGPDAIKNSGPPSLDEMSIAFGGLDQAKKMRDRISMTVEAKGFTWSDDVASVIPVYDYMQVLLESGLIDSWNFAISIMADGSNTQQLRAALEKALSNNPLFVSFYVFDQCRNPHYVLLRPSPKLWNLCILDHGTVRTAADVQLLAMQYPYREHATAPGPLFRCLIVHVEETGSAAVVTYMHHVIQDASSTRLLYEDLETTLISPLKELSPHVSYKAWADSFQALRHSPAATHSVTYHVHRLSNIHLHINGLYPPAPLPRKAITENPDGLDHGFDVPGLLTLKNSHPSIIAAVVLKAAMALVNVSRTQHTHSLFNHFEAARTRFPFVAPSVEALHPETFEAADVNGPVMQGVCNLVHVPRDESAIALLHRMQAEQREQTKHAPAPLRRVIDALNSLGNGAGDLMVETHRTQFLTWIPGFLGEYERIRVARIAIRCVAGLVLVAGVGGPMATTYMLSMRWEVANYSRARTRAYVEDLEAAVLWLTQEGNWTRPVGEFVDGLRGERDA